jgi:hypothetical protein
MSAKPIHSTRSLLRAFQKARQWPDSAGFIDDLTLLQSKDLDLSVRLGALLAADALLLTTAVNPIAASPGAPLSLDAPTQPFEVILVSLAVLLLVWSGWQCVRGILIGEEFRLEGDEGDAKLVIQRMLAAWCVSVDHQLASIAKAARLTLAGGAVTALSFVWIMGAKILG